jgi:hypothetical protein
VTDFDELIRWTAGGRFSACPDHMSGLSQVLKGITPDRLDPIQYPTCLDYIIPASVIKTVGIVRDDSSA